MSEFTGAAKAFDENLAKHMASDGYMASDSTPLDEEKFNLYIGLKKLAKGLEQLERKVDQLFYKK